MRPFYNAGQIAARQMSLPPTSSSPPGALAASGARASTGRAWLLLAVALSAIYAFPFALRGWIPHDEGTIAQSAERVLQGQVPHRDFDEGYTGGLSYLHAAAFRVGGVRLSSLRWLLYAAFLTFLAAVFGIARRLGTPRLAFALTLLAAVWSVPNYFASLPSWYNLFFATFAALALMRFIESPRSRWLVVAGLCAGLSVLIKQVGLYAIAAGVLFLVDRERRAGFVAARSAGDRPTFLLAIKAAGAAAFVALLAAIFGRRGSAMDVVELVLPPAALALFAVWDEARRGRGRSTDRLRSLAAMLAPFLAGAAAPVVAFGALFAASGSLRPLLHDVFVRSIDPTKHAQYPSLEPRILLPALLYAIVLVVPTVIPRQRERALAAVVAVGLALGLCLAAQPDVYRVAWDAARSLPQVVAAATVALLARDDASRDEAASSRVFLLAGMGALVALVQFPFASPIYFCYGAPLAALATAAVVRSDARSPRTLHAVLLVFFLVFAAVWMNRGYVFQLGRSFSGYEAEGFLAMPRGELHVPIADARDYGALIGALAPRPAQGGLYAGPDCPEVYFLSGRRNPTRFFFDYQGELYDPAALLRFIEDRGIATVVIDRSPAFSRPLPETFLAALRRGFSEPETIGRFLLYRRTAEPAPVAYNPLPR
jgi:Dolichyl-phosphate-mannose-protein mannosyltransferase